MKRTLYSACLKYTPALLLTALLSGCGGRPARKTLPDVNGLQGWEGIATTTPRTPEKYPGLPPFYAGDTSLRIAGRTTDLLNISLPDPQYDSLAGRLVASYAPFASSLFKQLLQQGRKGVLIDLRTDRRYENMTDARSTQFRVEIRQQDAASLTLPVVFCWNPSSAGRATALMQTLQEFPGFGCTRIDGDKDNGHVSQSCFSPSPTNFDEQ